MPGTNRRDAQFLQTLQTFLGLGIYVEALVFSCKVEDLGKSNLSRGSNYTIERTCGKPMVFSEEKLSSATHESKIRTSCQYHHESTSTSLKLNIYWYRIFKRKPEWYINLLFRAHLCRYDEFVTNYRDKCERVMTDLQEKCENLTKKLTNSIYKSFVSGIYY